MSKMKKAIVEKCGWLRVSQPARYYCRELSGRDDAAVCWDLHLQVVNSPGEAGMTPTLADP